MRHACQAMNARRVQRNVARGRATSTATATASKARGCRFTQFDPLTHAIDSRQQRLHARRLCRPTLPEQAALKPQTLFFQRQFMQPAAHDD